MTVVDAGVLIAYLVQEDQHHGRATGILTESAAEVLVPITLAEILVGAARGGQAESIMNRLAQLQPIE